MRWPACREPVQQAHAASGGGTIRFSMRVIKIENPPIYDYVYDSNICRQVCDYLTRTGADNVTRPWLLEKWQASDDLTTWTLTLKKGIKWSNGDELNSDHVIWNLTRWLDEKNGSSIIGLFKGFLVVDYDTGQKDDKGQPKMGTKLYSDKAIEKVDEYTIKLNGQKPQLAVPENLFHYPAAILHPADKGVFGVGAIGTGAFSLTEFELGKKAVMKRRDGYWGKPVAYRRAHLHRQWRRSGGGDRGAGLGPGRRHDGGLDDAICGPAEDPRRGDPQGDDGSDRRRPHAGRQGGLQGPEGPQGHAPGDQHPEGPADRPSRPRRAGRASPRGAGASGILQAALHEAEHRRGQEAAGRSGHPDGFEVEIFCKKDPDWEAIAVQAMVNMWKEIGVNVKMNVLPSAQYWDHWTIEAFAFTNWTHRPLGTMVLDLAYRTGVPWNESHYSNPKLDALLDQADATLDVEKRKLVMKQIEELMQEEGPIVQPLWRAVFTGVNKKVKGFKMHPTSYLFAEEWSL